MVNKLGCKKYSGARPHHDHQSTEEQSTVRHLQLARSRVVYSTCCHPLRNACWGRSIPVL